jgi:2-keto-3-deoxy-galactonokinase
MCIESREAGKQDSLTKKKKKFRDWVRGCAVIICGMTTSRRGLKTKQENAKEKKISR